MKSKLVIQAPSGLYLAGGSYWVADPDDAAHYASRDAAMSTIRHHNEHLEKPVVLEVMSLSEARAQYGLAEKAE